MNKPIHEHDLQYQQKYGMTEICRDMASEILESRAEIARLRAIVDTPVKIPATMATTGNDMWLGEINMRSAFIINIKEHGLKVVEDE